MIESISSIEKFNDTIHSSPGALIYFSHDQCNVCKVLKPKVYELLQSQFSALKMFYVNTIQSPDIAAQNSVFTVPTLLVFFDGKEFLRKSRSFGIIELREAIKRPYELMFE